MASVPPGTHKHTIVIVTASHAKQAKAVEQELKARQEVGGVWASVTFYAVPDPSSARVGSGGATFNALHTVQELVSLHPELEHGLVNSRVFMIHSGGDSQRLPCQSVCGKAWSAFPVLNTASYNLEAPIDLLLEVLLRMFDSVTAGLVIASSDVLLELPLAEGDTYNWPQTGATGLAVPVDKHLGPNHGVYHVLPDASSGPLEPRPVAKFFQKASVETLAAAGAVRADDTVLLDTGVIYFSPPATSILLDLATTPPLHACTYMALDTNTAPLRVELYSDIMLAMGGGMGLSFEEYSALPTDDKDPSRIAVARSILWKAVSDVAFSAICAEGGSFSHVGTTSEYLQLLTHPSHFRELYNLSASAAAYQVWGPQPDDPLARSSKFAERSTQPDAVMMNSVIHDPGHQSPESVIEHCELWGEWMLGSRSLASACRSFQNLVVRDNIAMQELRVQGQRVLTVLGVDDPIKKPWHAPGSRVCGASWDAFFKAAGVSASAIWPASVPKAAQTLWTAEIFPLTDVPTTRPVGGIGGDLTDDDGSEEWEPAPAGGAGAHRRGGSLSTPLDHAACVWMQWLVPDAEEGAVVPPQEINPDAISRWRASRRLSLKGILALCDSQQEFRWRRRLRGRVDVNALCGAIRGNPDVFGVKQLVLRLGSLGGTAYSRLSASRARFVTPHHLAFVAMRELDTIAATAPLDVAGRALAVLSLLLWHVAGWGDDNCRSGPAFNKDWAPAFAWLQGGQAIVDGRVQSGDRPEAVKSMRRLREKWLHSAHLVGRAARHYERASQLLVAQSVYTASIMPAADAAAAAVAAPLVPGSPLSDGMARAPVGLWVQALAPARVDLAGGWSDTPPLTYEAPPMIESAVLEGDAPASVVDDIHTRAALGGGLVINAAVLIDGKHPIGARARRTPEPTIVIRTLNTKWGEEDSGFVSEVVVPAVEDLLDFNQPGAQGALVKSALICLGLVAVSEIITPPACRPPPSAEAEAVPSSPLDTPSATVTLADQLMMTVGGGLEVETFSSLPQGSGMGTSSILASCVIGSIMEVAGLRYDRQSVVHLVLMLEQMLTTGGGWQDQVGGMYGGIKASMCPAKLPLAVNMTPLHSTEAELAKQAAFWASSAFLVYTGETRLAKYLLQRVLRQWALRDAKLVSVVDGLRTNAVAVAQAVVNCDAAGMGYGLAQYWAQKKKMAPGAEPPAIANLIAAIDEHCWGCSLTGAGGGGFLIGVAKSPEALDAIRGVLGTRPEFEGCTMHEAALDADGMVVSLCAEK